MNIKPNKVAFILFQGLKSFTQSFLSILLVGFFSIGDSEFNLGIVLMLIIALFVSIVFSLIKLIPIYFQYQKEAYKLEGSKFIYKSGSIFSDSQVELAIENITNVTLVLPFIETLLFKTGHIYIESAGSAQSEVTLISVDNPKNSYDSILESMRKNGFQLTQSEEVMRQSPGWRAVLVDLLGVFLGFGVSAFFILTISFSTFTQNSGIIPVIVTGVILIFLAGLTSIYFRVKDILNRNYIVYNDSIVYDEGFLTKRHSTLPLEKFADSNSNQTFLQQLFGIYTVKLSARGSTNEVAFKYLSEGDKVEELIDKTIKNFHNIEKTKVQERENSTDAQETKVEPHTNREFGQSNLSFGISLSRALALPIVVIFFLIALTILALVILPKDVALAFGLIAGIFSFLGVLAIISNLIQYLFTTYQLKPTSFRSSFKFLTTRNMEFQAEKVTSIIIKENPIDRILGTCTIKVHSIGSGTNIVFWATPKTPELYDQVLGKIGYDQTQETILPYRSKFSFMAWVSSHIVGLCAFGFSAFLIFLISIISREGIFIIMTASSILLILGYILLLVIYDRYYYDRLTFDLTKDFLVVKEGIITLSQKYAVLEFVKDITTVAYPFNNYGTLQFNIAGDIHAPVSQEQNQNNEFNKLFNNNNQQPGPVNFNSNNFKIDFVPEILKQDDIVDSYLLQKPQESFDTQEAIHTLKGDEIIMSARPSLKNALAPLIFFPPALIIVPIVIWDIHVQSYTLEKNRIVYRFGKIYKSQTSILYENIDHIEIHEGLLNKIFSNGSISINTEGSHTVEMQVLNIPNYKNFFDHLKSVYKK